MSSNVENSPYLIASLVDFKAAEPALTPTAAARAIISLPKNSPNILAPPPIP